MSLIIKYNEYYLKLCICLLAPSVELEEQKIHIQYYSFKAPHYCLNKLHHIGKMMNVDI